MGAEFARLRLETLFSNNRKISKPHEISSESDEKIKFSLTYLVGDILEAHSRGVERGGLFGVANPEPDVIEAKELADSGLYSKNKVVRYGRIFDTYALSGSFVIYHLIKVAS